MSIWLPDHSDLADVGDVRGARHDMPWRALIFATLFLIWLCASIVAAAHWFGVLS
jgi:hypothetical protein